MGPTDDRFGPVILRVTAKAAKLLRASPTAVAEPTSDDWYFNVVWVGGRKCALLAHAGTAFPIFVPDIRVPELRPLGPWLRRQITTALADEGLAGNALGELGIGEPLIAKTANRQLLGFMNETAYQAEWEIAASGGLDRADMVGLNRRLRRDLHNYGGRYATPLEMITRRET